MKGSVESFERHYAQKWTGHAGFWDEVYPRATRLYADALYTRRNEAILAALPEGARLLDVGCGLGDIADSSAERFHEVHAVDFAKVNARKTAANLRRVGRRNVGTSIASATALPFADETFDAVVLADVIEHVPDYRAALREVERVLAPNGRAIIVTPHQNTLRFWLAFDRTALTVAALLRGRRPRARWGSAPQESVYERFLSRRELVQGVRDAGLRVAQAKRICFYPGPEGGGVMKRYMAKLSESDRRRFERTERAFRRAFEKAGRIEAWNHKMMVVAVRAGGRRT